MGQLHFIHKPIYIVYIIMNQREKKKEEEENIEITSKYY